MSESTVTEDQTPEVETPEDSTPEVEDSTPEVEDSTPEVDENGIPTVIADDFGRMAYTKVLNDSKLLESKQAEVDAYQGNASAMLDRFRETYGTDADSEADDTDRKRAADLEKAKLAVLKLEEQRDSVLNARITAATSDAAEKVGPLLADIEKLTAPVKSIRKTLVDMFGKDALYGLPAIKGVRTSSGSSAAGTGSPRIRGFDIYVNGKLATQADQNGNQRSNLSAGAKAANVDTSVMQESFWTAQGTRDKEKFQPRVEFVVTDKDGNEQKVIAVKQA